jgi:hypothetical protein
MSQGLTRRKLIAQGAAAGAVLAFPTRALSAKKTLPIFRLLTGCGDGSCACNACKIHDAKSLFPTWKAANGNRAHIGCNCTIDEGTIEKGTWVALFGEPTSLTAYRVDLRNPHVNALVKKHPPSF